MTQHFTPSQNQYIAKLIKKAKAKERARINMNKFTPGQRSEIARLIKKAKVKERARIIMTDKSSVQEFADSLKDDPQEILNWIDREIAEYKKLKAILEKQK